MHSASTGASELSGNSKGRKRRFGSVRGLPSGKWQARYTAPDGLIRKAPRLFNSMRAAERWLVETEAEMLRGDWLDPDAGRVPIGEYADLWLQERDLKARTREEYGRHLRLHVRPFLGHRTLASIGPQDIRTWRAEQLSSGVGRSTVAKTYRNCMRSSRRPSTTTSSVAIPAASKVRGRTRRRNAPPRRQQWMRMHRPVRCEEGVNRQLG